jgi:glycosyltransferase involved in cell wall biosynthesis
MRLLIVTQKVDKNDDNLGFFHRWILEFAKHYEFITIIALGVGEYDLPDNVKVLSLGKERGASKIEYLINFYKYIWSEHKNYDAVFVHMNPIYVVLGGLLWKSWKKKVGLWYTHKSVDTKLRIAEGWVDYIFTASDKSFRMRSKKLHIMGHGIDADEFKVNKGLSFVATKDSPLLISNKINILHIGRISRSKNIHLFVKFAEILKNKGVKFQINIVGGAITKEDKGYLEILQKNILNKELAEYFNFLGPMAPHERSFRFIENDIFINLSDTGSMDKTVLEAMLSGIQVLVSNEAFMNILPSENKTTKDPERIAKDIQRIIGVTPNPSLRGYVLKEHNLSNLILAIVKTY